MWKANSFCMNCGDKKSLHSRAGLCRFEQKGWIAVTEKLPKIEKTICARRGHEVFAAKLIPESFPLSPDKKSFEWVSPYWSGKDKVSNGLISGITHWRQLRRGEPAIESKSHLT